MLEFFSFPLAVRVKVSGMKIVGTVLLLVALQTLSAHAASGRCNYDFTGRGYGCVVENVVYLKQSENLTIDGEHYPMDDDSSVQHFTIQKSEVRFVPPAILEKFKNLKYLALNNVLLSDITESSFANCGSLRELHLENNELTVLKNGVFAQCGALVYLHLNNNKISTIRKDAFAGLAALVTLHLEVNLYTTFPVGIFAPLPKLLVLFMGGPNFSDIHPETFRNNNLTSLTIYKSNLTSIHPDLFKGQSQFYELNILDNPIATIQPGTLQPLVSLKNFMLESSRVTKIDAGTFAGLKNLIFLDVSWNKINSIHSDAFVDLVNLKYIYLSQNQLRTLNGTLLRHNTNIAYMDISRSMIEYIPRNFFDSFANSLYYVSALGNVCIDKHFQYFTNFTTEVQPYFKNCFNRYDEVFPPKTVCYAVYP